MKQLDKIIKKRFSYKDILSAYPNLNYEQLASQVEQWCTEGFIVPIKNSGKTSFRPPIYNEYKKVFTKTDYSIYENEIKALNPRLNISRYITSPGNYAEQREHIMQFSNFLWGEKSHITAEMSVKEKSYAIWGEEKFLESPKGQKILKFNNLTYELLQCYYAPEPFFCTVLNRNLDEKAILISENKDTWYSISTVLQALETNMFCQEDFGLLIFGEGNKVTRENAITDFLTDYTKKPGKIYYIGDIDIAGIYILTQVQEKNKQLKIEPFLPIYKMMVDRAIENGRKMKKTDDNRQNSYDSIFQSLFDSRQKEYVTQVLEERLRIPQEILNFQDYLRLSK